MLKCIMVYWGRRTATLLSVFLGISYVFLGAQVVWADVYVYRDTNGTLRFTNVPDRPGYRTVKQSQSYTGYSYETDIYVYRDARGILRFTNVPDRPGYRRILPAHPALGRLQPKQETTVFDSLIREACSRYGVEFALAKAVMKAESAFDIYALSPAGAQGLMQLMPGTAALHGVANIYSPRQNIEGGVRHLRLLLDRFRGNIVLALAAYNAGAGAVLRYNGIPPYAETQQYVQRVLQYREVYRQRSTLDYSLISYTLSG